MGPTIQTEYCFIPIDNKTDLGLDVLRDTIEEAIDTMDSLKEPVPLAYLAFHDALVRSAICIIEPCKADA